MTVRSLVIFGVMVNSAVYAETIKEDPEKEEVSPLKTEVEFGYQAHSGNSDTQSLNTRFEAEYTSGQHRHSGEFKLYKLDKDGEEDKYQTSYQVQSDYKLGSNLYLYGSFKGIDSRHSAYFKDYTLSGGFGYQFAHSKDLLLEVELGPGYRYQEPNLDELDDDDLIFPDTVQEPIFRGHFSANWKVLTSLSFTTQVTIVAGESNTRMDSEISATNNITDDIALKVSQSRQYHDKVPEGLSKSDSILSVNLLFAF